MSTFFESRLDSIAEGLAKAISEDEIAAHSGMEKGRKRLIQEHQEQIRKDLQNITDEIKSDFALAIELIHDKMSELPEDERNSYQKEFKRAKQKMQTVGFSSECQKILTEPLSERKSLQCLQWKLDLSDQLLNFIYSIGRELQEGSSPKKTKVIFNFLLALNPYVSDYWGQFGLALLKEEKYEEARSAFLIAQFINAEDPLPIYLKALSYAGQNDKEEVFKTCQEGIELIEKLNMEPVWKSRFENLTELAKQK